MFKMLFPERKIDPNDQLKILKDGQQYLLPERWSIKDSGNYEFNSKIENRAFAHGGYVVGDKKLKGRTIQVEFSMLGATKADHDEAVNLAYSWFTKSDYDLYCSREDRYYKIAACSKIKADFEKGFKQRFSNVTVSLLLADPFRYAVTQTVVTKNYNDSQTEVEIKLNNPSPVDVPLIWTFTPSEGQSNPDISITHEESGESFILKDTLLTAPAVAVVNGETGTVRRDTGNSLNTFSGIFLHALPGNNTYKYSGGPCKVDISYTARWFI